MASEIKVEIRQMGGNWLKVCRASLTFKIQIMEFNRLSDK